MAARNDITHFLREWSGGNSAALPKLVELVYPELRRIAARHLRAERANHTLQPTALVHEAYIRLAQQPNKEWQDRAHFFAVAARVVRAVLVDHARARRAVKRGSGQAGLQLTEVGGGVVNQQGVDVLDLDVALRALEALDAEQGRIVELRYFAGLSIEETADALGTSPSTIKRGWLAAKTYIRRHLDGDLSPA